MNPALHEARLPPQGITDMGQGEDAEWSLTNMMTAHEIVTKLEGGAGVPTLL